MAANNAPLLTIAAKPLKGDRLIVVTNVDPRTAIRTYRKRWAIECLFGDARTRGPNLEDTRLTDPRKLGLLMSLTALGPRDRNRLEPAPPARTHAARRLKTDHVRTANDPSALQRRGPPSGRCYGRASTLCTGPAPDRTTIGGPQPKHRAIEHQKAWTKTKINTRTEVSSPTKFAADTKRSLKVFSTTTSTPNGAAQTVHKRPVPPLRHTLVNKAT